MKRACAVLTLLAGCKGILGIESGVLGNDADIDAPIDAPIDMIVDARTCFGTFQPICLTQMPPDVLQVTENKDFDAIADCTESESGLMNDVCVVAAKHIIVNAGVTIGSRGSRFIVFVGTEDITINGTIDAWNAGTTSCITQQGVIGSGGAGGSFGTVGGNGSANGTQPRPAVTTVTTLRRGCPGDRGGSGALGGVGGTAGSGIFLVSPSIVLQANARINASGCGGLGGENDRGGGGGGSGGFVLFDSDELAIDAGAVVLSLGGGGGGGGGTTGTRIGDDGTRASTSPLLPGVGGEGNSAASGDGGDGSTGGAGMNGGLGTNQRGSGGGGGGAGIIMLTAATPVIDGTVAPMWRRP